jgi:hypothetical protein
LPEANRARKLHFEKDYGEFRGVKVLYFRRKLVRKVVFHQKNLKNPNTIYLIVRTALHLTTAKV